MNQINSSLTSSIAYPNVEDSLPNQNLRSVTINNTPLTIKVVPDDHSDMELVYRLWYEVYVQELKYPITEGVNHAERKLRVEPNGSFVFCAFEDETCVGTLRTTHNCITPLEFEYHNWLPNENIAEISKMIIAKKYRSTLLTAHIIVSTFKFHEGILNTKPYSFLVFNTKIKLLHYYKLLGFRKLTNEIFIHPTLGYDSFLLKCSKNRFEKVCSELEELIATNYYTTTKWGIKHLYYKWTT